MNSIEFENNIGMNLFLAELLTGSFELSILAEENISL
jgi:hypothetical protein